MIRSAYPAVVAAALVASASLTVRRACHVPSERDLDAAAAYVRTIYAEGDLILVAPPFLAGPRQRLGDLALREPRHLRADDVRGLTRVHLVEVDALGQSDALTTALGGLGSLERRESFASVSVSTYRLASAERVVLDLRAELARASVSARYADGIEAACDRWDGIRWSCPRNPEWNYVGRETLLMDDQPRDCVWMHPVHAGGVLHISLPQIDIPSGATVVASFGFALEASRRARAPVRVTLLAGDAPLFTRTFPVEPGYTPVRVPAPPGEHALRLELSTSNNGAAHFCGELIVVKPAS